MCPVTAPHASTAVAMLMLIQQIKDDCVLSSKVVNLTQVSTIEHGMKMEVGPVSSSWLYVP